MLVVHMHETEEVIVKGKSSLIAVQVTDDLFARALKDRIFKGQDEF